MKEHSYKTFNPDKIFEEVMLSDDNNLSYVFKVNI